MTERKSYTLVLGCGEKGAAWTKKQNSEVIGLDLKQPKGEHGQLILGDVFNLPIKEGVINHIHADFIVNGLIDREIAAPQISENPDVLDTGYFPKLVRDWYTDTINKSHNHVRNNIQQVGYLLKTVALREMWRVLASNGRLEIIDLEKNINWINHYAPQIIQENPRFVKLEPLRISKEDFDRSGSLERLAKGRVRVGKLELTKAYPPVGTKLPLADFVR